MTSTTPADDFRRITLDGKSVPADAADVLIPGQPNPNHRPLTPILELFPAGVPACFARSTTRRAVPSRTLMLTK